MAATLTSIVNDLKAQVADLSARLRAIEEARVAADIMAAIGELSGRVAALDEKIVTGADEGNFNSLVEKVGELSGQLKEVLGRLGDPAGSNPAQP